MKQKLRDFVRWLRKFIKQKFNYQSEELPYFISIGIAAIIFFFAIKIFLEITESLAENELEPYDSMIQDFIISLRTDWLTPFFQFVTHLGDQIAYLITSILLAAYFWIRSRNWSFSLQMITVLIVASLSNIVLKRAINRTRPSLEHLVDVNTLSFPSGHAMSAMAFYGFLIYLCIRFTMKKWVRVILVTILSLLIVSIGLSRVYLGVHYPSDVAAGFLGGLIWVAFSVVVFNLEDLLRKRKKKTAT
jgi:membrane-associated phospholipid phosphatase